MFEGMSSFNLVEHQYGETFKPKEGKAGYVRALSPYRRPHKTKDGYLCLLAYTDRQWRSFWGLADMLHYSEDARFITMFERSRNIDALYEIASEVILTRGTTEWLTLFEQAEIPAGPVNSLADLRHDPHLNAIGFFRSYDHPTEGTLEIPDTPYRFDRQSLPIRSAQPQLGEHGYEVLSETGMTEEEISTVLQDSENNQE